MEVGVALRLTGMSDRALSRRLGLSPSTVSRFRAGDQISADALASLLAWLEPGAYRWIKEPTHDHA
jgi:transcriptional regulator with XRE-family HTH domain